MESGSGSELDELVVGSWEDRSLEAKNKLTSEESTNETTSNSIGHGLIDNGIITKRILGDIL